MLYRLFKKERAKESGALARLRAGTRKVAKVAKMEGRTHERKAMARKEAKGKRRVAREKPEHVGRVARHDTLQPGARQEATAICTPSMKMTVKTSKNELTTKKICKHGVSWKRVKMSSGKR